MVNCPSSVGSPSETATSDGEKGYVLRRGNVAVT